MEIDNQKWISILEYATLSGNSISTTRRYIKSGKIKSKQIDGKYFILSENNMIPNHAKTLSNTDQLQRKIKELAQEIDDLKTLIFLYESKFGSPEELENFIKYRK